MLFFALLLVLSVTLSCNYVGPAIIDLVDYKFNTYFAAPVNVCQPSDDYLINKGFSGKYVCESGKPVFYLYQGDEENCSTNGIKYDVNASHYKCDADTNCAYGVVKTIEKSICTDDCSTSIKTEILKVATGICFYSNVKIYYINLCEFPYKSTVYIYISTYNSGL